MINSIVNVTNSHTNRLLMYKLNNAKGLARTLNYFQALCTVTWFLKCNPTFI